MPIFEGLLTGAIYDGLKLGGKLLLGPHFETFQKAQKKAQNQLRKEFSEGELLAIFTTFNNMEWKLSFAKKAREEVNRNLIKGVEAINGQVFVDELVSELHENNKQYDIRLVKKVVGRFVEIVSEELRANHEILNYLQDIKVERIKEKIDLMSGEIEEILESQKRFEKEIEKIKSQMGQIAIYLDGLPKTKDKDKKALFEKGISLMAQYKYEEAIESFRDCLSLESDWSAKSALFLLIGNSFYAWNKWDPALGSWKEALDAAEKANDEQGQAAALGNLGLVYKAKGEWDKAIEFYNRALKGLEKIGDVEDPFRKHGMASTFNNLGLVYQDKGEWDKAIEFYNKTLEIDKKVGDEHGMAQTFNNLGLVYKAKGEWDKAIEFYEKSLKIKEKIGDEHGMAQTFNNLGLVYQAKGDWDKAIEFYNKSLKIKEKIGDEHGMAQTFGNMGNVYQLKGEWDKAIEFYNKSLKIKEKIGDEHGMAQTFNNLAGVYYLKGEWDEAEKFYKNSLEIKKELAISMGCHKALLVWAWFIRLKENGIRRLSFMIRV